MTLIFFHAFHLKFTINVNFVYIPVEATFSKTIVCPNHYGQYFNENGTGYIAVVIVSWLWSQLSSLTEHTSDNQLWIILVRNDIPQVAIYQIVTFFRGEQDAIKLNMVALAHWWIILCKRGGVSNGVIAVSATLTSRSCLPARSSTGIYRPRKLPSE